MILRAEPILMRRIDQVRENKSLAFDDLANGNGYGLSEHRAIPGESVKFPIFAARIGCFRQGCYQVEIVTSAK